MIHRVAALAYVPLDRLDVIVGPAQDVGPVAKARVLFDPPYQGAPRYANLMPRDVVLETAERWARVAERVTVCEREPLPIGPAWAVHRLSRRRSEWVTVYGDVHVPPLAIQQDLDFS